MAKTAGIAIDRWKAPTFTRMLNDAGYMFTVHPGVTADTLLLKIDTNNFDALQIVVEKANKECRQ